jgi:hypothetical protein
MHKKHKALFNKKFLEVQEPFFKKVLGRRRQHAAAPYLHGLKVLFPQVSISNKRVPAPQYEKILCLSLFSSMSNYSRGN